MTLPRRARTSWADWPRLLFVAAVLLALALIGINGLLVVRASLFADVFNPNVVAGASSHFNTPAHRLHDLSFALLYGTASVGLLTQLRRPVRNVAGLIMALLPWFALGLVFLLSEYWVPRGTLFQMYATAVFGGFTLSAVLLHPRGRNLLRSFGAAQVDRAMVAMVLVAAVPVLSLASLNVDRQRTVDSANIHWQIGHYGFMAAVSFTMVGLGLLASLRPVGWRVAAWAAGILPGLLGLASLIYPDADSRFSTPWALTAMFWGLAFIAVAERARITNRTPRPVLTTAPG